MHSALLAAAVVQFRSSTHKVWKEKRKAALTNWTRHFYWRVSWIEASKEKQIGKKKKRQFNKMASTFTHDAACLSKTLQSRVSLLSLWDSGNERKVDFRQVFYPPSSEDSLLTVPLQTPPLQKVRRGCQQKVPRWCVRELQTFKALFIHPYLFVCIFHPLCVFTAGLSRRHL